MANQEPEEGKQVPIEWRVPDDMIPRYASNMVVQYTGQEFIVSFFETLPPLLLGTPAEIEKKLDGMGSVPAECIARLIVSTDRMPKFIQALQTNLEQAQEKAKANKE
jgi:hypothetical protein